MQLCARICSTDKLFSEINFIKKLASWNDFPRSTIKSIINEVLNTTDTITDNAESPESTDIDHLRSYALI